MMRNTECPVTIYAHSGGQVERMFSQALRARGGTAQILYIMPTEFSASKPIMQGVLDDILDGNLQGYKARECKADVSCPATKIETKKLDMLEASAPLRDEANRFPPGIDVRVEQSSVLEISHKGVDAVALTRTMVTFGCRPPPNERIVIDKPYYVAIYVDNTVLAVGQVVRPDKAFRASLDRP
jgi:hypothetical protein